MLLHSFLSVGALAYSANAFLLPAEMLPSEKLEEVNHDFKALDEAFAKTVRLDCSTCPYAISSERNGQHEWTAGVKSDLEMNFASEDGRLTLSGVPFYPISSPPVPAMLSVKQVPKEDDALASQWEGFHGNLTLSYGLEIENERHFQKEEADVVSILMTVMGLDDEMINVDDIQIKLIQNKDRATIHSITTVPTSPNRPDAKCTTILCRVLTKLSSAMHSAKSASKSSANSAIKKAKSCCMKCMKLFRSGYMKMFHAKHHKGEHHHPANYPTDIDAKPGHHGHHTHKHHRGWLHSFFSGFKSGFLFIVFPIIMGIAFGFIASTLGVMVGKLVIFLWRLRRKSGPSVVYEPIESEEKDGLPAYQDVEFVDVAEKV